MWIETAPMCAEIRSRRAARRSGAPKLRRGTARRSAAREGRHGAADQPQARLTFEREDGLGVKLNGRYRQGPVLEPHDHAIFRAGGDLQAVGQALALDEQRVVAARHELARHAIEEPAAKRLDE